MKEKRETYLVLAPFFPSEESFRGSFIFDQLNEIRKQSNFNIEVVKIVSMFSAEKDYFFKDFLVRIFRIIDFPFFIFPGVFNWVNKIRFQTFLSQRKIANIRFSHSHISYPAAYLTEDLECKKIIQHHGLDVLQLMNGRCELFRKIQKEFLIRNTIKHLNKADINIGVSQLVLQHLRGYKDYVPKKEFVLYNGVDTSKFFEKETVKTNLFTIGCVANFWKIKDQITLIKSVQKILKDVSKIRLRLIGSGPTLLSCRKYVVDNNLSKYISFESELPHERLNDFYNEIDLFVLPSYYEAFGCVYVESWAANTPFIGVKGQGISEITPDKTKMLFNRNDDEDLLNKIKYFVSNNFTLSSVRDFDIRKTIHDFLLLDIFMKND